MKKILSVLIFMGMFIYGISQTIDLKTNGYPLKFTKVDTLFYSEYSTSGAMKANAKKEDPYTLNLKHAFGIISKTQSASSTEQPTFTTNFYTYKDGSLQAPTSQLFFKPVALLEFKKNYGDLGIIKEHPSLKGYYYLYVTAKAYLNGEGVFELCNKLYDAKSVVLIEPVFTRLIKADNPLQPWQWNIKNQGNVTGAVWGADMKVENAWCTSTGTGVRVAILDDGVDLTHDDLEANLLPGFDATNNNSGGAPNPDNYHGTSIAGIIASVDNTVGTIGIAYNSKIIPIRIGPNVGGFIITTDEWIANSFAAAVARGADVISNSWGPIAQAAQVAAAIEEAVTIGRNGKGCVVLFSAANANGDIHFPANRADVIAVGASTPCDTRKRSSNDPLGTSCDGESWWGSNFGPGLDVLAPGVLITTTDNEGSNGYVPGDYNSQFGGTSAACPNAAAVVALIIAANPNLTGVEARNILERNCFKIPSATFEYNEPNGTWGYQAGYGRVDAEKAVRAAAGGPGMVINGDNLICGSSATYVLGNPPCSSNISWSPSVSQVTLSSNYNTTTLYTNGYTGPLTLTAFVNSIPVPKQITVSTGPSCSTRTAYWYVNNRQALLGKCSYLTQIRPINQNFQGSYEYYANVWVVDPSATIAWSYVSSGGGNAFFTVNGANVEVKININAPNAWIRLRCTTTNGCGTYASDYWFTPQGSTATCNIPWDPNCQPPLEELVETPKADPERISLIPNPARGQFKVALQNSDKDAFIKAVRIKNKTGIVIYQQNFTNSLKEQTINLFNQPTDIYLIEVFDGKKWQTEKLSLLQ